MAYSEQDRTIIRHFLGYPAIFLQAEPRLEAAITATQSVADGGGRPDSNTENYILGLVYGTNPQTGSAITLGPASQTSTPRAMPATQGLLSIEQQIASLRPITFVTSADKGDAVIDAARGMALLRAEGRRLVNALSRMLATKPRADVFTGADVGPESPLFFPDQPAPYGW